MRMTDEDEQKYKDFCLWLKLELPQLKYTKPKVWAAFVRQVAGFLGGGHNDWMHWGLRPTIKVDNYSHFDCEDDGDPELQKDGSYIQKRTIKWYGYTVPTQNVDEIYIARDLAENTFAEILEATVLHELIHWLRKKANKDVYDEGPPEAFEKEAYGRIMRRSWNVCMSQAYFKVE